MRDNGKPAPFQITMRRFGRIQQIERMQQEIPLSPYFFDLLYLDGQPLFKFSYRERMNFLTGKIPAELMIPTLKSRTPSVLFSILETFSGLMDQWIDT